MTSLEDRLQKLFSLGAYSCSRSGRVFRHISFRNRPPRKIKKTAIKPSINKDGYEQVSLFSIGCIAVHRVVFLYFNRVNFGDMQINHINGNRLDNRISNLELVTRSENQRHSFRELNRKVMRGDNHPSSRVTSKEVNKIRKMYSTRKYTQKELGDIFGIARTTTGQIINQLRWK